MNSEMPGSLQRTTTNALGATYQFSTWLRNNNYHKVQDIDGLNWNLTIRSQLLPNPEDIHQGLWTFWFRMQADPGVSDLVKSGLYHEDQDARLLAIIGDERIPMIWNRPQQNAETIEECRRCLIAEIEAVRTLLKSKGLHDIKKTLVSRWVQQKRVF